MKTNLPTGLHVGCGPIHIRSEKVDWVNIDIQEHHNPDMVLDCLKIKETFGEESFDYIWTCHHLEHLSYPDDATNFLRQSYEVLKPGGIMRIAVPNLNLVVREYVRGSDLKFIYGAEGKWYYHKDTPSERLNFFIKAWEHQICYDFTLLAALLKDAGFLHPEERKQNQSDIPGFTYDRFVSESLYVEVKK